MINTFNANFYGLEPHSTGYSTRKLKNVLKPKLYPDNFFRNNNLQYRFDNDRNSEIRSVKELVLND